MAKKVKLLLSGRGGDHTDYSIQAFQRALTAQGMQGLRNDWRPLRNPKRALAKMKLMRQIAPLSRNAYLAIIMQVTEMRLFPVCYFAETMVYCFDCWPRKYDLWVKFFHRHKMRIAFITARQSADRMRAAIPGLDVIWLPEAIETAKYRPDKPLKQRTIDVLEMGRLYGTYHDRIDPHCKARGYVQRFSATPWKVLFPTEQEFYDALGDSKISICFPRCMTHPELAGDVETLTLRYLESIACKCVIVGHCPSELRDLFGYNPVVEADMRDPPGQLDLILGNLDSYAELLDRNYQRLLAVGTWDTRARELGELLRARGYRW